MKLLSTLTFSLTVFLFLIYVTENLVSAHHLKEDPVALVQTRPTPVLSKTHKKNNMSSHLDTCTNHLETLHNNVDIMNEDLDKLIQDLETAK